jgi:RNA recognition motif-containing protein
LRVNHCDGLSRPDVLDPGPEQVAPRYWVSDEGSFSMSKKLYVGNLPFTSTEAELRALFARHGSVDSVNVIMDRETGRPRGFAFVEMTEPSAATDAIKALDGTELGGRSLKVSEAQDKQRSGGGGGGGGYGRSERY